MTNPYFERPSSVTAGTTIRSDKKNSDLDAIESAFNALHDKLQHAVFLPETFSGNPNIPEQTVNDTFIYIDTSGNIALYPIATILEQFEEVEQRYNQINAWQAQVAEDAVEAQDAATLSQRFANEAENVEVVSGLYSAKHWAKHAEAQIPLIEAAGQAKVDAAQVKVDEAQTKVTLAQNYANAAKNVQVETGFYSAKHYSLVAADQLAIVQAAGQEKVDDAAAQVTLAANQANNAATQANNAASSATKADNFANYAHNQLVPNSGGKYSSYHWAKEAEAYAQQTLDTVNGDFVPSTRTVNGKPLSQNIILGAADIQGLSTVATSGSYTDLTNLPNVVEVGDFGLGDQGIYALNNDLDNAIEAGFYRVTNDTTNSAFAGVSTVIVNLSFNVVAQIQTNGIDFYTRRSTDSGANWTRWHEFWTDQNLVKTTSATDNTIGSVATYTGSEGIFGIGGTNAPRAVSDFSATADLYPTGTYRSTANISFVTNQPPNSPFKSSCGMVFNGIDTQQSFLHLLSDPTDGMQGWVGAREDDNSPVIWAELWTDQNLPNPVQTGDLATVATSGSYNDLSNKPTAGSIGAVPTSRTVNGKALSSNIALSASDVNALPSTTTLATLGGVPTSRRVNNKALTGDITLSASDVGALPDSQKGQAVTRVSGSFTATKLAGVTEYLTASTGNSTCTINDSAFAGNDKLIIHKQYRSGQLNITSGKLMYLPDGSSASSHHIPAGNACTVELIFTGSSSILRIYN